jgi:hypothetical protein
LRILWRRKVHGTATNCEVQGSSAPLAGHPRFIFCSKPWTVIIWPCILAYTQCGPRSSAL